MLVEEFVGLAARSGLYSFDALAAKCAKAPADIRRDADRVAQWLIQEGWMTDFQARRLLAGSGRRLAVGHFELLSFLGRGGTGNVYLARRRKSREVCALKVLPPEKKSKARFLRRFQREMEVSQKLSHPGIASGFEAGVVDDLPYLAMEYVPGPTLYRLVRKLGPLPIYWSALWLAQVCEALDYAHQHGVIHRDLKPSNIILAPNGVAKLLDLGLARWYDDDHNEEEVLGARRIVGSFDYIAPEQTVLSSSVDGRSDIYGLGCVLYFALTGRAPFQDVEDRRAKVEHHRHRAPIPLGGLRPDVPPQLARIVKKMMAKDPADRFQVAAAAADNLNAFCAAQPVTPMPNILFSEPDKAEEAEIVSTDEPIVLVEPEPFDPASTQFDEREITSDVAAAEMESWWQRWWRAVARRFGAAS